VLSFHAFPDGPLPPPQTPVVPELAGVTGWTTEVRTEDGRNWLEVTLVSGDLVVAVDPRELVPGEYHGTITIKLPRWTITILNVTLIVHEFPRLVADPRYLEFTYDGQTMPAPQKVKVVGPKDGVEFTCQIHTVGKVWVSLAPDPAVTPAELTVSVDPTGMATGVYDAVVGFVSAEYSSPVALIVRLVVGVGGDPAPIPGAPYVTAAGVVNGASYLHGPVAPGEILAIFGKDLGPRGITLGRVDRAAGWLGTQLAGTRFLFDGVAAPIIFLSEGQAAAIAPYGIHGHASTILEVERDGVKSPPVTLPVAGAFPGVFTTNMTGTGQGAILDEQYLVVSKVNPAPKGSKISIYLTGGGMVDPMPSDGELADPANLGLIELPVLVTVGGVAAELLYAGEAPFYASGLLQVDARLSPDTPAGEEVPVVVTIGGAASQPGVTMAVQ
jgi:uncharacterized protein (TIGR03437 family)